MTEIDPGDHLDYFRATPTLRNVARTGPGTGLLIEANEPGLSAQIHGLTIVDRCRCGDDSCATLYTEPRPQRSYGRNHRNVELSPSDGMIIIDVVDSRIACVEVLYRDEIREALHTALP